MPFHLVIMVFLCEVMTNRLGISQPSGHPCIGALVKLTEARDVTYYMTILGKTGHQPQGFVLRCVMLTQSWELFSDITDHVSQGMSLIKIEHSE